MQMVSALLAAILSISGLYPTGEADLSQSTGIWRDSKPCYAAVTNALLEATRASRWREERELQIHFIYTGLGEQMFFIFPEGTTMLLDCGAVAEGHHKRPAPVPSAAKGCAGA